MIIKISPFNLIDYEDFNHSKNLMVLIFFSFASCATFKSNMEGKFTVTAAKKYHAYKQIESEKVLKK